MERAGLLPAGLATGVAILLLVAGCGSGTATPVVGGTEASTASPTSTVSPPITPQLEPTTAPSAVPAPTATPTPSPTPLPPLLGLDALHVASGLDQPVFVTGAPGTTALFVVEREGRVVVVQDGVVADEPFLDLRDRLTSSSIEQGLLGLAFHPSYESTGRFFAYWTTELGDSRLAEFNAPDPTVANPESMRVVLDVDQPAERHNAGMLAFGPGGLLYLALGDGGAGGATAQDTSNLLGSILRIDVDSAQPYRIPAGNPFDDEIWVYGLRNPWRFSIDPVEGLVYIGDVGQDTFEEINVASLDGAGTNFGWLSMEGSLCFRGSCDSDGLTLPVVEYSHDDGCSVTGGHVYRGQAIPELDGHYFYSDWCSGFVRTFRLHDGAATEARDWSIDLDEVGQVTSFGVDNEGELYTVNWAGQLFSIVPVR